MDDQPLIAVTEDELSVDVVGRAAQAALRGGAGAVVTFAGTVRDNAQGPDGQRHEVEYLDYQAYRPMAEREMGKIAAEVRERWGVPCAIMHRIGQLSVGETSVVVGVASPHLAEAFEACRYAIDRVKESVPIWKKEVARDGVWWVEDPTAGSMASLS